MAVYSVRFTGPAAQDLEAILTYVAEHASPEATGRLLDELTGLAGRLRHFPHRGSVPKELDELGIKNFRQLVRKPYRMIYHVAGGEVAILLVADGRRDMKSLLEQRLLG